ncbi:hypothetical protein PIB30_017314 [Stylosanthes scabra]|uniref:Syntaxin 6/10/61 N-terminal domain-containing protein n=1 Tax=Stylosanthes scabra TaxID=79078 RepID=A0ABU6S7J5_9FABA|nr:hypothetical protein [Stylosanthes scabra]
MASSFHRWEKDPFFTAAEQVQESADRMESAYRTWIHAKKDACSPWNSDELCRDVQTALGTAKWQLDEFQKAVTLSYSNSSPEDARNRHQDFISAIVGKITKVEHSLNESLHPGSKAPLPWVRLDEGERNELAMFLSGVPEAEGRSVGRDREDPQSTSGRGSALEVENKSPGHRRAASADAHVSSWKIAVSDDLQQRNNPNGSSGAMHKVASLSGFVSSMESVSKLKWPKNGYKKLKAGKHHQESENALLPSAQLNGGLKSCYERSKSYLDGCDECYDKQLYGWYGSIQRQLQRSQYQMQYSRPVKLTMWIVILLCMIVFIAFCTM